MIEPLSFRLDLDVPGAHAFEVWTHRFGLWWPADHTVTGDPAAVVLEPRAGGRIFERTRTGEEIDWGEITAWDPPRRLAYLWHLRRDRSDATEVGVTFVDHGDGTSRIDIVHDGWERLGTGGSGWRDANHAGWSTLFPHFLHALDDTEATP